MGFDSAYGFLGVCCVYVEGILWVFCGYVIGILHMLTLSAICSLELLFHTIEKTYEKSQQAILENIG